MPQRLFRRDNPLRHRMPVGFGPSCGPRQGPDGRPFDWSAAERETVSVSLRCSGEALARLLPPRLHLDGEPVVTVEHTTLRNLPWLAGRGYSMLGVRWGARFAGRRDDQRGQFLAVLWENLPEPILTGREELGWAKLYCELPPPSRRDGGRVYRARWGGHEFFRLALAPPVAVDAAGPAAGPAAAAPGDGTLLHVRHVPALDASQRPLQQVVMTPPPAAATAVEGRWTAAARLAFKPATWHQIPTFFHVVNALAELPLREPGSARIVRSRGGRDLSDQRLLR